MGIYVIETLIANNLIEKAFELLRAALIDEKFDSSKYKDDYQAKLHELIQTKIAGKEVVAAKPRKEDSGKVLDLMDTLKASVKKAKTDKDTA